jgi:hypothetical protein
MLKSVLLIGLLGLGGLAACTPGVPVNANCAALGMAGGAALGAATNNDLAQSAIAGGVLGAIAGNQGACK